MKQLFKNLGIILLVIGTIILILAGVVYNYESNFPLGVGAVIIVVGMLTHIVINKSID